MQFFCFFCFSQILFSYSYSYFNLKEQLCYSLLIFFLLQARIIYLISTIQLCLSSTSPDCIPYNVSYNFCEILPISPLLTVIFLSSQDNSPTGDITAAVPVANISFKVPSLPALNTSSIVNLLSEMFKPHSFRSIITEFLVIPGNIVPASGAVIISSPITKKAFDVPISSTYFLSMPSSHNTWSYPLS